MDGALCVTPLENEMMLKIHHLYRLTKKDKYHLEGKNFSNHGLLIPVMALFLCSTCSSSLCFLTIGKLVRSWNWFMLWPFSGGSLVCYCCFRMLQLWCRDVSVAAVAAFGVYVVPCTISAIGLCFLNIAALVLLRLAWYVRFSLPTLATGLIILLNVYWRNHYGNNNDENLPCDWNYYTNYHQNSECHT